MDAAMNERGITAEEFYNTIAGLEGRVTGYVRERCDGIDGRLDRVNGRLDRHDVAIADLTPRVARHDENVKSLDREMRDAKRAATKQQSDADDARPFLTMRDARLIGTLGKAIWAAVGVALVSIITWALAAFINEGKTP
jgi:hypothetical protein